MFNDPNNYDASELTALKFPAGITNMLIMSGRLFALTEDGKIYEIVGGDSGPGYIQRGACD